MTKRIVLFGYAIEDGCYVPDPKAAATVQRIFDLYCKGASYNGIADTLNQEHVIYLEERPLWNKHIVKRILENPKYCGDSNYPTVIPQSRFQEVQKRIADKNASRAKRVKADDVELWQYITCGHCGGTLYRTGGGPRDKNQICLKCKSCGISLKIARKNLADEVVQQYNAFHERADMSYVPSEEVVRLANAVNRSLEKPKEPQQVIDLILRGITARYQCCRTTKPYPQIQNLNEINWNTFKQSVKAIAVTEELITVAFEAIDTI